MAIITVEIKKMVRAMTKCVHVEKPDNERREALSSRQHPACDILGRVCV